MSNIGPTYLAHIIVSQAEVRLVADETSSATAAKIKSDQNRDRSCPGNRGGCGEGGKCEFRYMTRPALAHELRRFSRVSGRGRTLWLRLRVADGLCQHLAQLSLCLRRFAAWGLPLAHGQYVGLERKLNPRRHCLHVRFYAHSRSKSDIAPCPKGANRRLMHRRNQISIRLRCPRVPRGSAGRRCQASVLPLG